jgi:GNAT superfamily N-acetyltransferase
MDVKVMPGLEQLPYAEVWFHEIDEELWQEASARARDLGKTGLEVWTTDRTPDVVAFLEPRGYAEVRRYVISELDVATAPDPEPPAFELVTFAERPDLEPALYELAQIAYADQPGRSESRISVAWHHWGLAAHPPEAYFIALEGERLLGYGYLEHEGEQWKNGFMAVAREARGRGVAGAIKRAQIAWAKANGVSTLRTANEPALRLPEALRRDRHARSCCCFCLKRCRFTDFFKDFGVLGGGGASFSASHCAAASSGSRPTAASRSRILFTPCGVRGFLPPMTPRVAVRQCDIVPSTSPILSRPTWPSSTAAKACETKG